MPRPDWLPARRAREPEAGDAAMWSKCPKCGEVLYQRDLAANLFVCSRCGYHFRMHAYDRIDSIADNGEFTEIGGDVLPQDPLGWTDKRTYPAQAQRRSRAQRHLRIGRLRLRVDRRPSGGARVMDFHFRGGTMGQVAGERITLLLEEARRQRVPCIIFSASGGARMEEGMLALMQMAKTTAAVSRFMDEGNFFVVVLTDPTSGGVSASFAFQADVIVAESKAMIGFAGRRVIEQTIRQRLPDQFQTAEFLLEKGAIDMVVDRRNLKETLVRLLEYAAHE